jgi:hypothetical protein
VVVVLLELVSPLGVGGGVVSAGGALLTVTLIVLLVVVFPAASLAMAVRVWVPLLRVVVSQVIAYGEPVSSVPSLSEVGSPE